MPFRVNGHGPHPAEVDDDAVVARAETGHAVAAGADGQRAAGGPSQVDRHHDVLDRVTPGDQRGTGVDRAVPDRPRLVVLAVAGGDDRAAETSAEGGHEFRTVGTHADSLPGGRSHHGETWLAAL
jgi:hypothetical protein